MFKFNKNPLGGDEFKKRLRSAARILVSDSIVRSHVVFDALADVITEAKPFITKAVFRLSARTLPICS